MLVHRIGGVNNSRPIVPTSKSTKVSNSVNQVELSNIPFYGAAKLNANTMNIQQKRSKLVKLIDSILEVISLAEMPPKEYVELEYRKMIAYTHQLFIRKDNLFKKLVELENPNISNSERMMLLAHYDAEAKKLKNALPVYQEQPVIDSKISALDTTLLSKFKNALLDDDYNLGKIFEEHFAPLAGIFTVAELKERFPRMPIPQNPYDVVADKLLSTLTRDFYETYDEYDEKGDIVGCDTYVDKALNSVFEANAPLLGVTPEQAYIVFADRMVDKIIEKHDRILDADDPTSFSSIPIHRKTDKAPITDGDVKLLGVDYDDYVTSVVKEIYLNKKKPNEIVYSNEEQSFSVNSVADSGYKFDKISERIKSMIADAAKIQHLQRNYDKFDKEELKSRLNFYSNKDIAENNLVFENIINFYSCNFDKEDVTCLKMFLKALDSVNDGETSISELEKGIRNKDLIPKGTEKLNQQELEEISQKYKAEQQQALKLSALKNNFDEAMNALYRNGMSNAATSLSKYRPEGLSTQEIENVDYICNKITDNLLENGMLKSKDRLESTLLSWDTYNFYKECEGGKEILADAESALLHEYGTFSPEAIGQYLLCNDIIEDYPKSMNYYKQPALLERIVEKSDGDKTLATLYLAKYEDYLVWDDTEKSQLTELLSHFDSKSPVGKMLLKQIIEDDYINLETVAQVDFNGNGKNLVTAKISPNVKQEILDKYKFPVCINYLVAFEEALSKVAASSDSAGIKQTGTNNQQLQYKMELKVNAYRDRLFSSNNDYNFDVYSEKGLH